jgi:hypothetical protein
MKAISPELVEKLFEAACEMSMELEEYEVPQVDDNGDFGNESCLGYLRQVLKEIEAEYLSVKT